MPSGDEWGVRRGQRGHRKTLSLNDQEDESSTLYPDRFSPRVCDRITEAFCGVRGHVAGWPPQAEQNPLFPYQALALDMPGWAKGQLERRAHRGRPPPPGWGKPSVPDSQHPGAA